MTKSTSLAAGGVMCAVYPLSGYALCAAGVGSGDGASEEQPKRKSNRQNAAVKNIAGFFMVIPI